MAEIDNILDDETINYVKIIRFENGSLFWIKNCNCENPLANFKASKANTSELNVGAYVAVCNILGIKEEWNRGVVLSVHREDVIRYRVFLIDEAKRVESCRVVALDEKYMREPSQANLVALYCVKVENSSDAFLNEIKSITSENEALYFQRKTKINGITFGHILIHSDNKYYKLQDVIRKEFQNAMKCLLEDEFARIIEVIANEYQTATNGITQQLDQYANAKSRSNTLESDSKSVNSKDMRSPSKSLVDICKDMIDISTPETSSVDFWKVFSCNDTSQRKKEFPYSENCCRNDDVVISKIGEECKSTFTLEVNSRFSNTLVHSNVNPSKERIEYITTQEATELGVLKKELARKLFEKEVTRQFPQFSTCQLYALPTIHSGNNSVLISGADLDVRRYAYLIPLANMLMGFKPRQKNDYGNIISPIAIILCPYAADCQAIALVLVDLLNRGLEVFILSNCCANLNKVAGKNVILVGTPLFFIRAYKTTKQFRFTNTRFLIFDSADILCEKYSKDVDNILNIQANVDSASNGAKIQIILSSQTWIPELNYISTRYLKQAIVIIAPSALMEAAIYGSSKFTLLHGVPKGDKVFRLREFLKKHAQKPTAILCCSDDEINEIKKIDFESRDYIFVTDDFGESNKKNIAENFSMMVNERKNPILICRDVDLIDICVENAQLLINFSVPESIKLFSYRFSTLLSNYKSIFSKYRVDTHVFTLLDNETALRNDGILENIYNWMKRTSSKNLEAGSQDIEHKLEVLRISKERDLQFCENIYQFGVCSVKTCESRHFLSGEKDTPVDYLRRGKIKLKIADTYSATHFAVKILEIFEDKHWRKLNSIKSYATISTFTENPCNLTLVLNPQKNDVVIAEVEYHYTRVIIVNIVKNNVTVKLIDEGGFADVTVNDLYEIPHELKMLPYGVVDLYIFGASPLDNATTWNPEATKWVKTQLKNYKSFTAKIFLTLGTKMWSDSLDCKKENGATLLRIPSTLIAQNLATKNTRFWPYLKDLCRKANLENYILNETLLAPSTEVLAESDKSCEISDLKTSDVHQSSVFNNMQKNTNLSSVIKSKFKSLFNASSVDETNVSVGTSSKTGADSSISVGANTLSRASANSSISQVTGTLSKASDESPILQRVNTLSKVSAHSSNLQPVKTSSKASADSSFLQRASTLSNDTGDSSVHHRVSPASSVLSVLSDDGTSNCSASDFNCGMDYSDIENDGGYLSGDEKMDEMLAFLNEHKDDVDPETRYHLTKMIAIREMEIATEKNKKCAKLEKVVKEEVKIKSQLNEDAKVSKTESTKAVECDKYLKSLPKVHTPNTSQDIILTPIQTHEYLNVFNSRTKDNIPNVQWYQSIDYIFVKIMIENCSEDNCTLFITCTNFTFKAEVNNKRYFLSATPLFGAIITRDSTARFNRSYVFLKMKKLIHCDWLRLIRGSQDRPWLSKDLENDCLGIATPSINGSRTLLNWKGKEINLGVPWTGHTMDNWVSAKPGQTSPERSLSESESDSEKDDAKVDVLPD